MSYIIDIDRCESPHIEIDIKSNFKCIKCNISTLYAIKDNINIIKPFCLKCHSPTLCNKDILLLITIDGETFRYATYEEIQYAIEKYYDNKFT